MRLRLGRLNLPRAVYRFAALAFVLRIVARLLYTGIANFWVDGYTFFFDLAQKGLQYILAHPQQTVIVGFRKNAAAFYWLPSPRRSLAVDLSILLSYGPVMLLGLWGMLRHRAPGGTIP
jgi:hypothetical protein